MKTALYIISALCWLQFAMVALNSKSAIHEIEYILFALVAIIAMASAHIIGLMTPPEPTRETKPLSTKKRFWAKPGQLD